MDRLYDFLEYCALILLGSIALQIFMAAVPTSNNPAFDLDQLKQTFLSPAFKLTLSLFFSAAASLLIIDYPYQSQAEPAKS